MGKGLVNLQCAAGVLYYKQTYTGGGGTVQYVPFGATGLRVSRVGLGGIPLQRTTAEQTVALVRAARAIR